MITRGVQAETSRYRTATTGFDYTTMKKLLCSVKRTSLVIRSVKTIFDWAAIFELLSTIAYKYHGKNATNWYAVLRSKQKAVGKNVLSKHTY